MPGLPAGCQNETGIAHETETNVSVQPRAFEVPDDAIEITDGSSIELTAGNTYAISTDLSIQSLTKTSGNVTLYINAQVSYDDVDNSYQLPDGLSVIIVSGGRFTCSTTLVFPPNGEFIIAQGASLQASEGMYLYTARGGNIVNYGTAYFNYLVLNFCSLYNLNPGVMTVCSGVEDPQSPGQLLNTGTLITSC